MPRPNRRACRGGRSACLETSATRTRSRCALPPPLLRAAPGTQARARREPECHGEAVAGGGVGRRSPRLPRRARCSARDPGRRPCRPCTRVPIPSRLSASPSPSSQSEHLRDMARASEASSIARACSPRRLARVAAACEDPRARPAWRSVGEQAATARSGCSSASSRRPWIQKLCERSISVSAALALSPAASRASRAWARRSGSPPPRWSTDGSGPAEEELGALRIVLRPEPKGRVVEALGGVDSVKRSGSVARVTERTPRRLAERGRVEPGGLASSSACR